MPNVLDWFRLAILWFAKREEEATAVLFILSFLLSSAHISHLTSAGWKLAGPKTADLDSPEMPLMPSGSKQISVHPSHSVRYFPHPPSWFWQLRSLPNLSHRQWTKHLYGNMPASISSCLSSVSCLVSDFHLLELTCHSLNLVFNNCHFPCASISTFSTLPHAPQHLTNAPA